MLRSATELVGMPGSVGRNHRIACESYMTCIEVQSDMDVHIDALREDSLREYALGRQAPTFGHGSRSCHPLKSAVRLELPKRIFLRHRNLFIGTCAFHVASA